MGKSKTEKTWAEHWETDDTPWDAGSAAPSLIELLQNRKLPLFSQPNRRALVAGCGSGYDVFSLAQSGFSALGLDIAPAAVPRFVRLRNAAQLTEAEADLKIVNFFEVPTADLGGQFDLIWDYTFYCAIEPSQREEWKRRMRSLLAPEGMLAMLLFPVVAGADPQKGPPYPLDPELVAKELSPEFQQQAAYPASQSHPGRETKEWMSLWMHPKT